jgi:hypothetical protein
MAASEFRYKPLLGMFLGSFTPPPQKAVDFSLEITSGTAPEPGNE